MPKCYLTKDKSKANRIWKDIKLVPRKEIALITGVTSQAASYKVNHIYKEQLEEMIKVLDLAGYEIREKD